MLRPTVQHSCASLSHRPWTAVLSTYLCRLYDVRLCPAQSTKENVELVDSNRVDIPLRRHTLLATVYAEINPPNTVLRATRSAKGHHAVVLDLEACSVDCPAECTQVAAQCAAYAIHGGVCRPGSLQAHTACVVAPPATLCRYALDRVGCR